MRCLNCRNELTAGNRTCPACGEPISALFQQFIVAEERYTQLLAKRQAGTIDQATFDSQWAQLTVQDLAGGQWIPGAQDGGWYWYDGRQWVKRDPREAIVPEKSGSRWATPVKPPWYKRPAVWIIAAIVVVAGLAGICGGGFLILRQLDLIPARGQVAADPGQGSHVTIEETAVNQTLPGVTAEIGVEGGEVAEPAGARVVVPAEALVAPAAISIAPVPAAPELPAELGVSAAGPAFEVTLPPGIKLQDRVELALPLERQPGVADSDYTVVRWDGDSWSDVGGIVEGDEIHTQLRHFSIFGAAVNGRPRRPVGFRNGGPYDATIMPWTYVPLGTGEPALPPTASTVSFAPGAPGGAPNPSRFLSLPLGSYTFCVEWTDKKDKDEDGYFDYYYVILDEPPGFPLVLTEDHPTDLDLAVELTVRTDSSGQQPGTCPLAPVGQLQIGLRAGEGRSFSRPPQLIAFANVQNNAPPSEVSITSGGELWRYNEVIALMEGGHWIEAHYSGTEATAVGVQFLGDTNDGWARVLVDGVPVWVGSVYGTSPDWSAGAFVQYLEVANLPPGPHTIRVEALGIPGEGGGDDVAIFFFGFSPTPVQVR